MAKPSVKKPSVKKPVMTKTELIKKWDADLKKREFNNLNNVYTKLGQREQSKPYGRRVRAHMAMTQTKYNTNSNYALTTVPVNVIRLYPNATYLVGKKGNMKNTFNGEDLTAHGARKLPKARQQKT